MNVKERLKNLTVKKKLDLYKICMIIIIAALGAVTVIMSFLTNSQVKEITEVWSPSLSRVQELDSLTSTYRIRQYGHLVAATQSEKDEYDKMLAETDAEIAKVNEEFDAVITMAEERELFEDAKAKWETYKKLGEVALQESRMNRTEEAGALMVGELFDTYNNFHETFDKLLQLEQTEIDISKRNAGIMFGVMIVAVIVAVLIGIFGAAAMSKAVTQLITEPVEQITEASKRLYEGDMSAADLITYESEDELGIVAASLSGAMRTLQGYIHEISAELKKIATGDLTKNGADITDFRGDFADIKESIVYILKRFNSTLTEIQQTSDKVAINSKDIEGASQTLADGATDQASAIQQLTASIETVSGLAEESAKNTQEAYVNIRAAAENAEKEKEKMNELTREMARITEISKQIENIITAIEDIASQTNLLSLNASIEAARAGEAGRGFAVVADQIGKLASDSAQSAVNTRELIHKTLVEIEQGNNITASTSVAFDKIIEEMKFFAGLAQKTSETADSQSSALEQIEQGIDQIAEVVQNTAASAEETTAVSVNLADEAEHLDELVKRFKLY